MSVKNTKKAKQVREADPLALYFKQISKFPLLNVHEEQAIGEKIVASRSRIAELNQKIQDMSATDTSLGLSNINNRITTLYKKGSGLFLEMSKNSLKGIIIIKGAEFDA